MFKYRDFYFKKAKENNYLARSIFKLEELDQKFKLIRSNDLILELGYYPGSWTQYLIKKVKNKIIGVDINDINLKLKADNLVLKKMDIFNVKELEDLEVMEKFDLILSDMAPKTTGTKITDQSNSLYLIEKIYQLLPLFLKPGGKLLYKAFESKDLQNFIKDHKKDFKKIDYYRPKATRKNSKEFFVVNFKYQGN